MSAVQMLTEAQILRTARLICEAEGCGGSPQNSPAFKARIKRVRRFMQTAIAINEVIEQNDVPPEEG